VTTLRRLSLSKFQRTKVSTLSETWLSKEKKSPHLNHIVAPDLDLWQVSIPIDNLKTELGNINLVDDHRLFPLKDVAEDCLRVIAKESDISQQAPL